MMKKMQKKLIVPKELRINVTDNCNLNCMGCSKDGDKDQEGESLTLKQYFTLIDEWAPHKEAKAVSITGGEPLIPCERQKTYEIIKHVKSYDLEVRFCTNGHYLTKEVAAELKTLGVDNIQVGLDSSTKEFQNKRCKSIAAWQKAITGIKNSIGAGLNTSVRYTIYKSNLQDVAPTYRFVSELGVSTFKLRALFPTGAAIDNCKKEFIDSKELSDVYHEAVEVSKGNTTKLYLCQPVFYTNFPECYNIEVEDNLSCGEWNNASINSKGKIEYCLLCDDGARFGNIKDNPFLELWNSPKIKSAREERKRKGKIIGCPALQVQYQAHIGNYITDFEKPLIERTRRLQKLL